MKSAQPNGPTAVRHKGGLGWAFLAAVLFLLPPLGGAFCQNIAINETGTTAVPSALLDLQPDVSLNKGLLIPRLTTAQRNAIAAPALSLLIFNTTNNCLEIYNTNTSSWQSIYCLCAAPSAPVTTVASGVSQTSFSANWNASAGATTYYLDVATDIGFTLFVSGYNNLNVGNVTTYGVTGLTCATTYYYRVRASNPCGTSANSNTITQATTACCSLTANAGSNQTISCGSAAIGGVPTASGGTVPYTYNWSPSTGLNNPAAANPTASPSTTTTYNLIVTDAGAPPCVASSSVTVTVNSCVSNTWCQKANFGGTARQGAVGFSIGTKGYIGTGNDGAVKQDFWEWCQ